MSPHPAVEMLRQQGYTIVGDGVEVSLSGRSQDGSKTFSGVFIPIGRAGWGLAAAAEENRNGS